MATFGDPTLNKMLKDMAKQRADATKAQQRGARGGATPNDAQMARMLNMRTQMEALETSLWANEALYRATQHAMTQDDPRWTRLVFDAPRPTVGAERFRRMGPGNR